MSVKRLHITASELDYAERNSVGLFNDLIDYHDARATEADAMDMRVCVNFHDERKAELRAVRDHIRDAHDDGDEPVFANEVKDPDEGPRISLRDQTHVVLIDHRLRMLVVELEPVPEDLENPLYGPDYHERLGNRIGMNVLYSAPMIILWPSLSIRKNRFSRVPAFETTIRSIVETNFETLDRGIKVVKPVRKPDSTDMVYRKLGYQNRAGDVHFPRNMAALKNVPEQMGSTLVLTE